MATFALIDTSTHNVLGEFASRDEAENFRTTLVAADPSAAPRLRIELDDETQAPPSPQVAAGRG
jgi:hypothetical protein